MSNMFTGIVSLGKDPEALSLGGRECFKIRCAEKGSSKKAVTRWFTAIVGGPDANTAPRLAKGDTIAITGELILTEYTPKTGPNKGKKQTEDEMPFAKIMKVIKSPTFFADSGESGGPQVEPGVPSADAPAGDSVPDLEGLD